MIGCEMEPNDLIQCLEFEYWGIVAAMTEEREVAG